MLNRKQTGTKMKYQLFNKWNEFNTTSRKLKCLFVYCLLNTDLTDKNIEYGQYMNKSNFNTLKII